MKTPMDPAHQPLSPRCAEIRERLEAFAGKRLGPAATADVQDHVLGCDGCSDALAELLMEQVADGSLPLLTPPSIPPPTVYENYLRARRTRFFQHCVGDQVAKVGFLGAGIGACAIQWHGRLADHLGA